MHPWRSGEGGTSSHGHGPQGGTAVTPGRRYAFQFPKEALWLSQLLLLVWRNQLSFCLEPSPLSIGMRDH